MSRASGILWCAITQRHVTFLVQAGNCKLATISNNLKPET
jgi:hypothetical protein